MKKLGPVLLLLAQTFVLSAVTIFCVAPVSCRATEEGIVMLTGDYEAPKLTDFSVIDESTLQLVFSESVKLLNTVVSPKLEGISDSMEHSETAVPSPAIEATSGALGKIDAEVHVQEDGRSFTVVLEVACEVGKSYEFLGIVEDKVGNTLTFCIPFTGFNSRIPELIITEAQIKYAKGSSGGKEIYRGEFVEFLTLKGGNLGGLELVSGSDGESKKYCFPAVEVEKGQVFIAHLRTVAEGCVDEREDFDEAKAPHSAAGILDLWSENTSARLHDNADVIVVRNGVSGLLLDAFMYADVKTLEWKSRPAEFAAKAAAAGIYETGDVSEAVLCSGVSPLKSFKRTDAEVLCEAVLAGEDYVYPVRNSGDLWEVGPVTPGTL